MNPVCASVRSFPIPDPRPASFRWQNPIPVYAGMVPLPLDPSDALPPPAAIATDADPERDRFVAALLRALLDTISGRRPATQLTRWVNDEVYADLLLRTRLHQREPMPLALRTFRVQAVSDRAVEVSARIQAGPRYAALALRLERLAGRWECRVAEFGPLAAARPDPLPSLRDRSGVAPRQRRA